KRAVAGLLPPETIRRKKQGFSIPVHQWLRTRLRPIVCDALSPRRTEDMGLFRPAAIQQLLSDHFEGRRNNGFEIWGLLILSLWHEQFIRNFPPLVSGQRDA
ncbi:MAG: asparagine synthetase B, partial [Planctomycetes bacterium]|nr:asparagine synthetase B [Planctomycetota bacterium]